MSPLASNLSARMAAWISGPVGAAEKTIGDFLNAYDQGGPEVREKFEENLYAIGLGILSVITELKELERPLLFCPPLELRFSRETYFKIFRIYVEQDEAFLMIPLREGRGLLLLQGLIAAFPCKK